jgi:hypothetical protein
MPENSSMTAKLMAIFALLEFPAMLAGVYLFARTDHKAVGLAIAIGGGMLPSLLFVALRRLRPDLPAPDDRTE